MATAPETIAGLSLEDFLERPEIDEHPYLEYVDGKVIPKVSPQYQHSRLTMHFLETLNAAAGDRGEAVPELRCTYAGRSIVPDVVFLLEEHIGYDEGGEVVNVVAIPPDLHIEIISPKQGVTEADEKLRHSTAHGCALGWLVHPYRRTIDVYRPGTEPVCLGLEGVLEGEPVLPGFRLPVAEVFGWLKRRRGGGRGRG